MVLRVRELNCEYSALERNNFCAQKPDSEQGMLQFRPQLNADEVQFGKTSASDENKKCQYDKLQKAMYVGGVLPPLRRIGSLPCSLENGDYVRAALLTAMAAGNFPGDLREISLAGKEFAGMLKGVMPSAKNYAGQHKMTLLDGTFFEPVTRIKGLQWLDKIDEPIWDSAFGRFLQDKFQLAKNNAATRNIKIPEFKLFGKTLIKERSMQAFRFHGNHLQKLVGKSLMRVSKLGVIFASILEIPALVSSVKNTEGGTLDKTKAFSKQLLKSAGYVGIVTGTIALTGAAFGATAIGSLAGMAVGSAIGLIGSKMLNKTIDNIFKAEEQTA